jgi:hypothetical protein
MLRFSDLSFARLLDAGAPLDTLDQAAAPARVNLTQDDREGRHRQQEQTDQRQHLPRRHR